MKGIFIVLEGIDGSGKSEQVKHLHNYLFDFTKKNRILTTREPTYGIHGAQIREMSKNEKDPFSNGMKMFELFVKDRREHLDNIVLPFLNLDSHQDQNIIICDRYYHSTYAFQQTQGIDFKLMHEAQKDFLKPTITFIFDLDPDVALKRIHKVRSSPEKFEKIEFMTNLRENYLKLKDNLDEEIVILDASKSIEEVFEDILSVLKERKIINSR